MESTGSRLKNLRLEKGISLQEVHKKTKLHLNILRAIEDDALVGFNPVYIKGFLKIYCKFLGVDPKDYIVDYKEPTVPVELAEQPKKESLGLKKPVSFIKTNSVKWVSSFKSINIKLVFLAILIIFLAIGLFNLGKFISSKRGLRATGKTKVMTRVGESASSRSKQAISAIMLGVRAKQDCWIELRADGRLMFRRTLKKGQFESWQAKDKIEFSLGNAGGIELELNGKAIPSIGRRGQVVRNITITKKEGLVIPR